MAQQKGSIAQYVALAQQKGSMRDTALVSGVLFFVVSLSAVYLHYVTDFFFYEPHCNTVCAIIQVYTRTPDTCAVWRIDPFCWAKNRTLFAEPHCMSDLLRREYDIAKISM